MKFGFRFRKVPFLRTGLLILGSLLPSMGHGELPKVIRIGGQGVLSGAHADYGRQMKMGATMAVDEINEGGGILGKKVELQILDEKLNPDVGLKNFESLVKNWGAHVLIGIDSSGVATKVARELPKWDRVALVTHAATEELNEVIVFKEKNKHVFRIGSPTYQDGILAAQIFKDRKDIVKWAGINADYGYGKSSWKLFKEELSKHRPDVEFVEERWAPFWTTDFNPLLMPIIQKKPDAVFATPWAGEAVVLLNQALLLGVFEQVQVWWQATGGATDILQGIAREVNAGKFKDKLWGTARYLHNHPASPANQKFVKKFRDRWIQYPSYSAETAYSAVYFYKAAVEKAKSVDTAKVIKALEGLSLETPAGKRTIRPEDHQAIYSVAAGIVQNNSDFDIPVLDKLVEIPAKKYYREPPFE